MDTLDHKRRSGGPWRALCFTLTALLGGGCDLQTKNWAEGHLSEAPDQSVSFFEPWLDFTLTYNRGTAFSLVSDLGTSRMIFGALALAMVVAMFVYAWRTALRSGDIIALGLIAAGGIGNGLDRLSRAAPGGGTGVVDFIKINYPWGGHWPIFNVADVLVFAGVILFVIGQVRQLKEAPPVAGGAEGARDQPSASSSASSPSSGGVMS